MGNIFHLDRTQKIAFARIISDLIEADFIVEDREMDFFEHIISKEGFNITESMLVEAKQMDLAKAVSTLKELDKDERDIIIDCLKKMALSDGTCVPLEAIQIFALEQAIECGANIYSVPSNDIGIDNMKVIYIENEDKTSISKTIETNYRAISNDFALAGFDFVYIPFVVNDYKKMDGDYLKKVVRYMIPSIPPEKAYRICNDLQNMTTSRFCRDLLYKKINIPLLGVGPSLLIKINESSLIEPFDREDAERKTYANFLRIDLKGTVMDEIRSIIDSYRSMINCSIIVNSKPKKQKFMYYGFHRSLFDLIAYGREKKEYKLVFDLRAGRPQVFFEPVDGSDERVPIKLTPQETALYVMIVKKSFEGDGLDWRETENMPKKKREEILNEYNSVYIRISRNAAVANEYKDRTQIHRIKNKIRANQCVANMDIFVPEHVKDGKLSFYRVAGTESHIKIIE